MGHSHGQPFRQDTAPLIGLHLPIGFRDVVAFSLGEKHRQSSGTASNGGLPRYARECYPHSTALIWLNATRACTEMSTRGCVHNTDELMSRERHVILPATVEDGRARRRGTTLDR
jgi:hypothetical protein